jgi:hypothetical protein
MVKGRLEARFTNSATSGIGITTMMRRHGLKQKCGVHAPQTRADPARGLGLPLRQQPVASPVVRHDHQIAL